MEKRRIKILLALRDKVWYMLVVKIYFYLYYEKN